MRCDRDRRTGAVGDMAVVVALRDVGGVKAEVHSSSRRYSSGGEGCLKHTPAQTPGIAND